MCKEAGTRCLEVPVAWYGTSEFECLAYNALTFAQECLDNKTSRMPFY